MKRTVDSVASTAIKIPELCLVVLVGTSGSGKSTFARKHFKPTEIVSSDFCRGVVSDDENDQSATSDAFELLHYILNKRLALGKLCVVDATNVQSEARKPLVQVARENHVLPVAIVLDVPESVCQERNKLREDRDFGPHVIRRQRQQLRQSIRGLEREGFRYVHVLSSVEAIEAAQFERTKLWTNKKDEHGPFDIIGDIHGCYDELYALLDQLGYREDGTNGGAMAHPAGRRAIFLGDLVDRGPKTPQVLKLVMSMVRSGNAFCVPGNHDTKLMRKLKGRDVRITHGLKESLEQLEQEPEEFRQDVTAFIDSLVSHYVMDDGKLVVAHAGMNQRLQGRSSPKVRDFALYGETTGETDEYGLPVRYNWAQDYRGEAMVVYGHTPVAEPEWINRTICIDTGCVFGGKLTALRYPERELVSVPATHVYYEPVKPLHPDPASLPPAFEMNREDILDIEDVSGKRHILTVLHGRVVVKEENATAALEVMSRFALDPKWLIYLPPTMSPTETTTRDGLLEHPHEAFTYFRSRGVGSVVCEEKHMGSRAIVIVARDLESAQKKFGRYQTSIGACFTRTGRKFFNDESIERDFLEYVREALTRANYWDELGTTWIALDCEIMPWSAKAQELIRRQYAAVAAASKAALDDVVNALSSAERNGIDTKALTERFAHKQDLCSKYRQSYRNYCWEVESLKDVKLAPFHILATEKTVHTSKNHLWHMQTLSNLAHASDGMIIATRHNLVDLSDKSAIDEATVWWEEHTAGGGEGMVIKPLDFVALGQKGLIQPAVKCRGREYLRIIYGPEYTMEENLNRLRSRGLGAKRSLALREFALGIEALERFVREEPLYRVHECVFAVLALESEPVDPRL